MNVMNEENNSVLAAFRLIVLTFVYLHIYIGVHSVHLCTSATLALFLHLWR